MLSYSDLKPSLDNNSTTAVETVESFLKTIREKQHLNAFLTLTEAEAREAASESETRFKNGEARSLDGMIVAIKDNISTKGIRTTCASRMLENFTPLYDAFVIEKIKNAGGIIVGKTNMDEFAMGSSNENSAFGGVEHPLGQDLVPGGSSGGSAVAVAAGLAHVSLGSDTGGSVRQPAAFCGVVGLKPTYGRISRSGLVAFASSLDQIGIFANSIEDTALLFDTISGHDPNDSTTANRPPAETFKSLSEPLSHKFTVAVLHDEQLEGCSEDVLKKYREGLEVLKSAGAEIVKVTMPVSEAWIPMYYILATAEASSNLARFDGVRYGFRAEAEDGDITTASRSQGFGPEVQRRIMLGTYVLSSGYYDAYYLKAQKARRLVLNAVNDIFSKAEVLYMPTTPTPAFKRGEKTADPIQMYLSDYFTVSANLAGNPAISVPVGNNDAGLPIGMQLQTSHFEEGKLLQFSKLLMDGMR
ncbi:MAG TPA: Asp-tRNA(Asn)/Glu-tRNA(Gln) amidotransferase subunit GatA [Patescibacteria group bacterium]|nr:Asp-tRNA(Asn)/Glu-tRNA(Gln) amidotransferase subunit GatA [Patescibacteria group bacterium]